MSIRSKLILEHKELPSMARYEIIDKINNIKGYNRKRNKALVAFLYLTGCRIEEVCKYIIEKNPHRTIKKDDKVYSEPIHNRELKGHPIKRKQIEVIDDTIIIRNVRSLKRKKGVLRSIPILIRDEEKPFIKIFGDYSNTLDQDDYLFPITRQQAYNILKEVGLFCHYLRHLRLTHLVTDYNFSGEHLKDFTGWSDSSPASTYVHLSIEDLVNKMRQK